jgi:hypothetical protein
MAGGPRASETEQERLWKERFKFSVPQLLKPRPKGPQLVGKYNRNKSRCVIFPKMRKLQKFKKT